MKKLSFIIPVYNVEKYVSKCIESCLRQDLDTHEYEIIIIDDGSSDGSLKIVQELAARHADIILISQENMGISVARNNGLKIARGEYVWFVDSDDCIEENVLGKLLNEAIGADMLAFGGKDFTEAGEKVGEFIYNVGQKFMSGLQFIKKTDLNFYHGAPFYIYRREFLINNKFEFYPGIYHEDSEFTPRALLLVEKMAISSGSYYHRTVRIGSTTRSVNTKRAYDLVFVAQRMYDYIGRQQLTSLDRTFILRLLPMFINGGLNAISVDTDKNKKEFSRYFYQQKLFKFYFGTHKFRYFVEGILLCIFRRYSVEIYMFLKS